MRPLAVLATTTLLAVSCGQGSGSTGGHSPSPSARPSATSAASPSSGPTPSPTASNYGLLLSAGTLDLIAPNGTVAAGASVAAPTVQSCGQGAGAVLQPPVSASADKVYFRDGDTKIRYLTPTNQKGDATTVPGSATIISFFSVSPDDQRIAVVVEDLSAASTISLRLYVEDLSGGGHHADIYSTTTPKGKTGSTLWPMGWHQGLLVLALVTACTFEPAGLSPSEWHVSDAVTAARKVTIGGSCVLSYWPSPAGVACVDNTSSLQATAYDWNGRVTATIPITAADYQSGLSPSGARVFFATGQGIGAPAPATRVFTVGAGQTGGTVAGHSACLFIDEDHLLAPDAVIALPSGAVTPLPASGVCAGHFPGGL
jgi:hypothetical protein